MSSEIALAQTDDVGYKCFTEVKIKKIAKLIKRYQKCKLELKEKTLLIDKRLTNSSGIQTTTWWQEPYVIVGGMAISFSLGSLLVLAIKSK